MTLLFYNSSSVCPLSPFLPPPTPPEFTKNFGVKAVMKTSVLLTWEVPETYKSQVPFKVSKDNSILIACLSPAQIEGIALCVSDATFVSGQWKEGSHNTMEGLGLKYILKYHGNEEGYGQALNNRLRFIFHHTWSITVMRFI